MKERMGNVMDDTEVLFHTPGPTDAAFPYIVVAGGNTLTTRRDPPVMRRFNQHVLILTTEGAGVIDVGGRQRQVGPGTLVWLDTGRDYAHACAPRHKTWRYLWLGVQGFGLAELFGQIRAEQDPVTQLCDPQKTEAAMRTIQRRLRSRSTDLPAANSADVAAMLATLLADRKPAASTTDTVPDQRFDRLCALVRGTLTRPWTVQAMADAAALSPSQLFRIFRSSTNQTPMAWLKNERINAAKPLLLKPGNRVRVVAEAVGYTEAFHFSRDFRALVGRSPRAFCAAGGA